ncbi:MAG: hypothetical protein JWO88_3241 [Frankiales bacterium]|nr:hypothetical protein [Frankiales bacterium]
MEHFRAAERALVTALVLGDADPLEFSARLSASDFTDPAAAVIFRVVMDAGPAAVAAGLPAVLQRQGLLRPDGYPLSDLLEWLPGLPVPVHPQAWATLVVAGTLGRQVSASGLRLLQAVEAGRERSWPVGKVLAVVAAPRAATTSSWRRWAELPASWRDTLSSLPDRSTPAGPTGGADSPDGRAGAERTRSAESRHASVPARPVTGERERMLLAGLLAAPQLLGRIPWLREEDFTDRACGSVFATLRREHERDRPVDVVTLAAVCEPGVEGWAGASPAAVARDLRPAAAVPTAVPFLSRLVLGDAVLREVERTGTELVQLAQAPAPVGGLGAGPLSVAQDRLEALRPHAVRWEAATRPQHRIDLTRSSGLDRVPALERATGTDRSTTRCMPATAVPRVPDRDAG